MRKYLKKFNLLFLSEGILTNVSFFQLYWISQSRKQSDYSVNPISPQLTLDYTNMSVYLALDLGHHYISWPVYVCLRESEWMFLHRKQDGICKECCAVVTMNEECEQKQADLF